MLQFYKVLQIFVKFPSQLYIQSLIGYFPPSFIRTIRRYSFQFSNSRHAGIISRGCNSYPNSYSFGKCDRAHSSDFRVRYWWPYRLLIWNCTKLKWTKACKSFLLLLILVDYLIYSSMSILFILTLASVNKPTAGRIWGYRGVLGTCLLLHLKSRAITYNSISQWLWFHLFSLVFALTKILCSFRNYFRVVKDYRYLRFSLITIPH